MSNRHHNRETWLRAAIEQLGDLFDGIGKPLPAKIRASIGFTSHGLRGNRIGECWQDSASADHHFEIFVVPTLADPVRILDIMTHELVHVVAGAAAKHGPKFRKIAVAIGLEGKMKATVAGPALQRKLERIVEHLGPLPHGALDGGPIGAPKKQTTRMLKLECTECGVVLRASQTAINDMTIEGFRRCPKPDCDGHLSTGEGDGA